jgi:DNA polymerase-1
MPQVYAIDWETWKIEAGMLAPPPVCLAVATRLPDGNLQTALFDRADGLAFIKKLLEAAVRGEAVIVMQNGVYDMAVSLNADESLLSLIFEAYDVGAIRDIKERQKLIDLADGEMKFKRTADGEFMRSVYTLEAMVKHYTGRQLDKSGDSWRLRY